MGFSSPTKQRLNSNTLRYLLRDLIPSTQTNLIEGSSLDLSLNSSMYWSSKGFSLSLSAMAFKIPPPSSPSSSPSWRIGLISAAVLLAWKRITIKQIHSLNLQATSSSSVGSYPPHPSSRTHIFLGDRPHPDPVQTHPRSHTIPEENNHSRRFKEGSKSTFRLVFNYWPKPNETKIQKGMWKINLAV